jgi:hypothetical protein
MLKKLSWKDEPVRIAKLKVRGRPVWFSQKFAEGDDWLNGLSITVKNVSDKPINFVELELVFPRPEGSPEPESVNRMLYGEYPAAPGEEQVRHPNEPPILPGKTADLVLSDYDGLQEFLRQTNYPAGIREVQVGLGDIVFGDGTKWGAGGLFRRDPDRPERWNRIDKKRKESGRKASDSPFRNAGLSPDAVAPSGRRGELAASLIKTSYVEPVPMPPQISPTPFQCYGGCGENWFSEDRYCGVARCNVRYDYVACELGDEPIVRLVTRNDRCVDRGTHVGCSVFKLTDFRQPCIFVAYEPCYINCGEGYAAGPDPYTGECGCQPVSPVLVDVEGDGFDLTSFAGGVAFDINNDGITSGLAWTAAGADDAFLVLDRDNNGSVDNGAELFGNFTPQPASPAPNGFRALAEYDKAAQGGNGDGVVSAGDSIFPSLRLWRDTNHNGLSESSELHTLNSLGVTAFELNYHESRRTDEFGNQFRYRAKVRDAKNSRAGRWAWDVFFAGP